MGRLHTLDYLRGIAAFGIMMFHYLLLYGNFDAQSFIGRFGIYGVSIFYVLSGLTLYHVYRDKMEPSISDVLDFARKRFFRIYPILWLATLCTIILLRTPPDIKILVLNLTGLFGFFDWESYYATGVWSIGNELVFYLFFPVFMFLANRFRAGLFLLTLVVAVIFTTFAFVYIDSDLPLDWQKRDYVNPLNQLFLFLGGFLIGMFTIDKKINGIWISSFFIIGLALLLFYPATGDRVTLVTGWPRIWLTFASFLICLSFYKAKWELPNAVHHPLRLLGEASYSLYLLHPIVIRVVTGIFNQFTAADEVPRHTIIITAVILSLFVSYLSFTIIEKAYIKMGARLSIRPTK